MATKTRSVLRKVRHVRVRKRVFGTAERPRLAVFRSLKHISAQLIDDVAQQTVCSASSMEGELKSKGNKDGAKSVGVELGKRAKAMGINAAVFDRGGFKYHGTISSLADGAREAGLEF